MKNIKNLKKKIFGITLVVGLLVLSIVGTTMAYFTDTDAKQYTFTSGNVAIAFNGDIFNQNVTAARPAQKLASAAVVKNTGSEEAYVGIVITFNKALENAVQLFTKLGDGNYTVACSSDKTQIFVVYNEKTTNGNEIQFFEDITVPALWGNDEMTVFAEPNLEITVKAYAVQSFGLEEGGAVAALKTAFANDWAAMPTGN